jgi:plastocyanin
MVNRAGLFQTFLGVIVVLSAALASDSGDALSAVQAAQEQRVELIIRDSAFLLSQPAPMRLGLPTVIILRNQDIIRHGFTSPMLIGLVVHGEGEGVVSYGKGVEGFYVDPGKTLIIRFTTERPGSFSFRCDLHTQMKGELFLLEVPTA